MHFSPPPHVTLNDPTWGPDVCRGRYRFPSSAATHVTISSIDPRRQRGSSLFTHRVQMQARLIYTVRMGVRTVGEMRVYGGREGKRVRRGERVERDPSP